MLIDKEVQRMFWHNITTGLKFRSTSVKKIRKNISENLCSPCGIPERKPIPQGKSTAKY
jgi:hypothetical protein